MFDRSQHLDPIRPRVLPTIVVRREDCDGSKMIDSFGNTSKMWAFQTRLHRSAVRGIGNSKGGTPD